MTTAKISDLDPHTPLDGSELLEIETGGASYKVTAGDVARSDPDLAALAGLISAANKIPYFTGAAAAALLSLDTDGTLAANSDTSLATQKATKTYVDTSAATRQPLDADLTALAALATAGLTVRTGAGTVATRTLTAPAAGISVSNGDGVAGNPTLALADDLAALEALSGTNTIYYRSGASTWSAVTIGSNLAFSGGTLSASAPTPSLSLNTQTGTSYTVVSGDIGKVLNFTNTSQGVAVSLPQATGAFGAGFFCYITSGASDNSGSGLVITPTTSTINGKASYQLRQGGSVLVVSDGTNYQVISLTGLFGGASGAGFSLNNPDGTAAGGNARGDFAVDLQLARTTAAKVASGAYAFAAGSNNLASGTAAVALGDFNSASGSRSFAAGESNTVSGADAVALGSNNQANATNAVGIGCRTHSNSNKGQISFAPEGVNSAAGSGQTRLTILFNRTTGSSAVRLTSDGSTAGATNIGAPFSGGMVSYTAEVVIFDKTNQKSNTYTFALSSIAKPTNAASTVMGTSNPSAVAGPTTGGGLTLQADPTITADTTNGGFNVSYTPPSGNTADLRAVCRIIGTDVV